MSKRAICVGTNYVGTDHELRGCVNDANDWSAFLARSGFTSTTLLEEKATRAGILFALKSLISNLKPGDVSAATFSGHGTWVPDVSGDEPDGRDEAIVPHDVGDDGSNLILDDEFKLLFDGIPKGAKMLFITDCCHSGSVFRFFGNGGSKRRVRFLPPSHFIKNPGTFVRMERAFGQPQRRSNAPLPGLIHYSGCRDNEYSADAEFDGRYSGAMTYFALKAFAGAAAASSSYGDAYKGLKGFLPSWEFQQTPQLNCTADLKKVKLFD